MTNENRMGATRTIIHLNGRDYDASSGSLRPLFQSARNIDGVVKQQPIQISKPLRSSAAHALRPVQKAQTLSRSAVKKPGTMSDIRPSTNLLSQPHKTTFTPSSTQPSRSPQIKKFDLESRMEPKKADQLSFNSIPSTKQTFVPRSKKEMLIDGQLHKASSHNEPNVRKKRAIRKRLSTMSVVKRRVVTFGASGLAVLLIGGFVVYNNLAGISMTIASRRAGFSAMLPTYTPNGYSLSGPVSYSPGRIILSFASNTNDNSYLIEQTPSAWSTETLKEQVSSTSGSQYQSYQIKGLTIFFTNNNSATWVDRGVLFSLKGDSGLSGDQIAQIAASM